MRACGYVRPLLCALCIPPPAVCACQIVLCACVCGCARSCVRLGLERGWGYAHECVLGPVRAGCFFPLARAHSTHPCSSLFLMRGGSVSPLLSAGKIGGRRRTRRGALLPRLALKNDDK